MPYTLLRGSFVIRYPDLPRQGPEPDGDSIKFLPDTPALVETLPRRSGRPADINARGISVRLEAIDALETHFEETHQELAGANAARDELLAELGFTNVVFFDDLPNKVQSADQDALRGHVLSNGIDANGRLIAFIYPGDHQGPDGAAVYVDSALVDQSVNAACSPPGWSIRPFMPPCRPICGRIWLRCRRRPGAPSHQPGCGRARPPTPTAPLPLLTWPRSSSW